MKNKLHLDYMSLQQPIKQKELHLNFFFEPIHDSFENIISNFFGFV